MVPAASGRQVGVGLRLGLGKSLFPVGTRSGLGQRSKSSSHALCQFAAKGHGSVVLSMEESNSRQYGSERSKTVPPTWMVVCGAIVVQVAIVMRINYKVGGPTFVYEPASRDFITKQ